MNHAPDEPSGCRRGRATAFLAGGAAADAAIDITADGGARRLAGDQTQAVGVVGRTVYHSHVLDHEGLGMMGVVQAQAPTAPGGD